MRKSGIDVVGDVAWGAHFCQFYETPDDLFDILAPYFAAGLAANEFCMWVVSSPVAVERAKARLREAIADLDKRVALGQIEILDYEHWYVGPGGFDGERVARAWADRLDGAILRGFDGMRVAGDTFWLENDRWLDFARYEADVGRIIGSKRMIALCAYSLEKCGAPQMLDVIANHDFALIRRDGRWASVKSLPYHRAQQALTESEERFRLLVEGVRDYALFALDPHGLISSWNEGAERIAGWTADEIVGRHFSALYPAEKRIARAPQRALEIAAAQGAFKDEGERIRKDGSRFYADLHLTPLWDGDGRLRGYAKVIRDVTDRKRAELALAANEARLRATIEGAIDAIVTIDEKGSILSLNSAALRMFGYELDEALGRDVGMFMPEPCCGEHKNYLADRRRADDGSLGACGREVVGRRKDGSHFPLELTISEASHDGARIFVGFLRDLTERRKTEARIEKLRADRLDMLARMAVEVAHEVNQPLSAIGAYLSVAQRLLRRDPAGGSQKIDQILGSAAAQVMRAGRIIGHMRGFVVRGEPDKTLQSLHDVIRDVCAAGEAELKGESVGVRLALDARADRVIIDKAQILQVLSSLTRNAVEAMRASRTRELVISTSLSEDGSIRTNVSDTGVGLSEEVSNFLFEPFMSTKAFGLGVGLSVSRSIIEAHYGKMWAEPNPAGGAIMSFTLPLADSSREERLLGH